MSGPETPRKNFVQQIFRVVQVHLDFFQDHLAFFFYIFGIELGPQNEIGNDVERNREMLVEHFGVEANLFFGGEGVQHSADGIHLSRNGFRGAPLRAFEDHVLHEMGQAIFFQYFAARAVAHPNADRDGTYVGHCLRNDHQAIGEDVLANVASLRCHTGIVTQQSGKKKSGENRIATDVFTYSCEKKKGILAAWTSAGSREWMALADLILYCSRSCGLSRLLPLRG